MRLVWFFFILIACLAPFTESKSNLTGPELAKLMKVGTLVVRGADWSWGDQDSNGLGSITKEVNSEPNRGWVGVKWNAGGSSNSYRMGDSSKYELTLASFELELQTAELEECKSNLTMESTRLDQQLKNLTEKIKIEKKNADDSNRKLEEKQLRVDELESINAKLRLRLEASNKNLGAAFKLLAPFLPQIEQKSANKQIDIICEKFSQETKICEVADFEAAEMGMEIGSVMGQNGERVEPTSLIIRGQTALFMPTNFKDALPGLKELEVSSCGIFFFDRRIFQGLDQLESLNLSGNQIFNIEGDSFNDLKMLEVLDLSYNSIESIGSDAFSGLDELKMLMLNDNKLKNIPKNFVAPLKSLESVDFANNVCINSSHSATSFDQMKAWLIDNCTPPIQFECNSSISRDICRAVNLQIENPKTKILNVVGMNQSLAEGITELIIEDQLVKFLPDQVAKIFPKLQKLVVSRSQLTLLTKTDFEGLADLKQLEICDNSLVTIDADTFHGIPQLEHLDLSSNHIHSLPAKLFEPLTRLSELRLSINDLQILDSNVFPATNAIKVLKIDNNKLEVIDLKILKSLKALNEIDLSGNICIDEKYQKTDENSKKELGALIGIIFMHCTAD